MCDEGRWFSKQRPALHMRSGMRPLVIDADLHYEVRPGDAGCHHRDQQHRGRECSSNMQRAKTPNKPLATGRHGYGHVTWVHINIINKSSKLLPSFEPQWWLIVSLVRGCSTECFFITWYNDCPYGRPRSSRHAPGLGRHLAHLLKTARCTTHGYHDN